MRGNEWTKQEDAILRRMWAEGELVRDIASALGRTRSAVVGRANRSGLPLHAGATNTVSEPQKKSLLDFPLHPVAPIRPRTCQWPMGNPFEPGFHPCGAVPVVNGKPYCAKHCARAYQRREPSNVG